MARKLIGIQPEAVWQYFEELSANPRPSKKEGKATAWLINWAKEHKFEVEQDKCGNVVIRKPATPGMENKKAVIIQGHIDMVCEKETDIEFDFENEGIRPYIDGDYVTAEGTTLGADDGIAIAMGMAILASTDIPHPAMELLATLDEETGLTGATSLGTNLLKGDILINLDSEVEGTFTIGCAGGINTEASFAYKAEAFPKDHTAYKISLKGFRGGHSGIEIIDGRANATKVLNRIVYKLTEDLDIRLSHIEGGSKHNAIPRDGYAIIAVPNAKIKEFEEIMATFVATIKNEWESKEPNIIITTEKVAAPNRVMAKEMHHNMIKAFYACPHGVLRMSPDVPGLVQSSTNFAIVETRENEVYLLTNQRSSVESEKDNIVNKVKTTLELGGAKVITSEGYPAWQPNIHSPILQIAANVYENLFGNKAKIEIIHAGLECGLIGEKYPHMDMLSFGPTLVDVHSPSEKCHIPTTIKCYQLLQEILKNIPNK
ncbi:MAG: aminoacyl-histidine dipeptidase [Candidatus Kapabacteria bacterium]|nr:aminoacyl-histidine dipeptidase [Candidatus Kapabacteria bacterium]